MKNLTSATIEIITSCNFKCPHCYLDNKTSSGISVDEWKSVINKLMLKGCRKLIITGGEPLLYKEFISLYTFIHQQGIEISLFTNASLMTEKHFELFGKYPPSSVSVSIYGKNNREIRNFSKNKRASLDKIMSNIARLEQLGITIYKGLTLCKSISVSSSDLAFFSENKIEINTYLIPSLNYQNNLGERLEPNEIVQIENNLEMKRTIQGDIISIDNLDYFKKCSGGHSSLFVDQFGLASICAVYRKKQCNIVDRNINDVWAELNSISEQLHKIYYDSKCGQCVLNAACRNCPAYMDLEHDEYKNEYLCDLASARMNHN
ncbi:radical SAM protein [Citrobacter koseri]|uniref:radical SAM protein n=2 Tax=Citrobacter koseri TaxID=545 RepID=UPI000D7CB776|nr:radical SAM protein [Citrobacter koseri]PYZ79204.1 radical SAM protein [Citrobacter koseri]